jgi:anti-sigma factor RsiW
MNDTQRSGHPPDAVIAAWTADQGGDLATGAHVGICAACAARAQEWRAVVDPLADTLRAGADAHVPDSRLARQRADIMRRLRGEPRARVLRFPAAAAAPGEGRLDVRGHTQRWVAAAALLGLAIGGGTARYFDPHLRGPLGSPATRLSSAPPATVRPASVTPEITVADEAFLVELDAALVSYAPEPLRVLDALTPERDPALRPR